MTKALRMQEFTIPSYAVLISHEDLLHAPGKWIRKYCLWYHMDLILEEVELKDAIVLRTATA